MSVDGTTPYVITLAEDAIPAERTAASELQHYLERVTGAVFAVRPEAEVPADAPQIVVGPSARFRGAFPSIDTASIPGDSIFIKTEGQQLYLAGGRPRGTLYAVYTFLEDVVGCRWWTSTEEYAPVVPSLVIPPLDVAYTPKLMYREAFYRGAFDGVFAARLKCNGHFEMIPPEYGGHYSILGWCHTFYQLLPPEKYFAEHPDWYSEIDGKRTCDRAQLCLTNEAMRAELTRNALEWIRRDPSAGIISISQNDWHGSCQCAACKAVEAEEDAPSGLLIRFVNAVAGDIEREFPDMWVETLAYQYTRKAPKLARPGKNVIVRLCTIECSFCQPLETGPQNKPFRLDIDAWSAVAPHLYIWDYVTNFCQYLLPHPNLRVLAPNIRFFVDRNAIGLFEQGDAGCACGDFVALRAWVLAHLMWNPSRDPNALVSEFLQGYYGPAAEPLQEYLDLVHTAIEKSGAKLPCYLPDTSTWLPLEDLNTATALFDAAGQKISEDAVLFDRVRKARMVLDYAWLNRYPALGRQARLHETPYLGPADPAAFCEAFIGAAERFDIGNYSEGGAFKDLVPALRARCRPPARPPAECAGMAERDWVDIQDNEFQVHNPDTWAAIVDDAKASDGKAARMPADHTQWAVQYGVPRELADLGPLQCFVVVRAEARTASGTAFNLGIYAPGQKAGLAQKAVSIEDSADGTYHSIDLGRQSFPPGAYVWIAPCNNPDQMEAVYIDRIFFIR
ncbi:MAG: hypothetical protein BWY09_01259 [Candidatus Hydrogenedentes bacterium ADurb.Bin179]|nr:MAG: hypothetical protein BWY09_01259 [Candidatus Hydrogenedentes bacterium ADurb.Bin179]